MIKKLFLLIAAISICHGVFANDIAVKIYTTKKITTSNPNLQIGDFVDFNIAEDVYLNSKLYLKKDEKVTGLITNIDKNKFDYQTAKITITDFKTKNINNEEIGLKGFLYKTGNDHWMWWKQLCQGLGLFIIRGGEVQIKPKDRFNLYIEE